MKIASYSYHSVMDKELHLDSIKIDLLGGTNAVARLCKVRSPSVSKWRLTGIPKARRMILELKRPDVFVPDTSASEPVDRDIGKQVQGE